MFLLTHHMAMQVPGVPPVPSAALPSWPKQTHTPPPPPLLPGCALCVVMTTDHSFLSSTDLLCDMGYGLVCVCVCVCV